VIGAVLVWMLVLDQEKIMTAEDRGAGRSVSGPVDALVEEFRGFLSGERGLAPETVRCYGTHARAFLAWLPQPWTWRWRSCPPGW
jgi:hypothetical protein